ncbi:hypothetical protein ACRRTK_018130 [Alexandromys fortis]
METSLPDPQVRAKTMSTQEARILQVSQKPRTTRARKVTNRRVQILSQYLKIPTDGTVEVWGIFHRLAFTESFCIDSCSFLVHQLALQLQKQEGSPKLHELPRCAQLTGGAFVSLSSHPDISHGYVPKVLVREAVYGLSLLMAELLHPLCVKATLSFCHHGLHVGSVQGAWLVEKSSVINFSLRKDVEEVTKGMKLLLFSAGESGSLHKVPLMFIFSCGLCCCCRETPKVHQQCMPFLCKCGSRPPLATDFTVARDENVVQNNGMNGRTKSSQSAIDTETEFGGGTIAIVFYSRNTESKAGKFKNINICVVFIVKERRIKHILSLINLCPGRKHMMSTCEDFSKEADFGVNLECKF